MALFLSPFLSKFPSSLPQSKLGMRIKANRMTLCCQSSSPKFFDRFVDGVLSHLYLPTRSESVSYNTWKWVAAEALFDIGADYKEELFGKFPSYRINDKDEDEKIINVLEEQYSYMLGGIEEDSKKYSDLIELKKKKMEERASVELYEKARLLKMYINKIRAGYKCDIGAKALLKKQLAIATYLIDIFGFGSEKDDDLHCCSVKVGDVEFTPTKLNVNSFSLNGVDTQIHKAIRDLMAGKNKTDYLFHEIDTESLSDHLEGFMLGLSSKVFCIYNASITLDAMLSQESKCNNLNQKLRAYEKAINEVVITCNHQQRSKSHAQNKTFAAKIKKLKEAGKSPLASSPKAWEKRISQHSAKIKKLEQLMHKKDDVETLVLGTSKICYTDPRITFAWCKRNEVPIEKIFNESLLAKFAWARDVEPEFRF